MIVRIDMHLRDERLLKWLSERNNQKITAQTMADVFKCHPNTIRAMTQRLERAGYIEIMRSRRGGHTYAILGDPCNQN